MMSGLRCRNCHAEPRDEDVSELPAFPGALYHPYADDPALPCGPVRKDEPMTISDPLSLAVATAVAIGDDMPIGACVMDIALDGTGVSVKLYDDTPVRYPAVLDGEPW